MSLLHWVWLGLAVQPGSPLTDRILERFPDPEEFFLAGKSGIDEVGKVSDSDELRIRATTLDMAKKALERAEDYGAKVLSRNSELFPRRLLEIENCPSVLYVLGDESCLNNLPAIAVVGTRRMSEYGRKMTDIIAGGLGAAGAVVVSGMAEGVDSAAHKACLAAGGKTVAVQGCGICNTYPNENLELKELIAANGAVISEFAPDAEPQSSFFLIRNRIVSGLSLGVCVVEAAARSGTSVTARLAESQGRRVFAVPADVCRSTSKGTLRLLKEGALPVGSAEDILGEYTADYGEHIDLSKIAKLGLPKIETKPEPKEPPAVTKKPLPDGVSKKAAALYALVDATPRFADELSVNAGLSAAESAAALTELEIYGLIRSVPGRRFVIA